MLRAHHAIALAGALLLSTPAVQGATSTQQSPTVTFPTFGAKQVTLRACNFLGCTESTQTVTVFDPRPLVATASFAPALPEAGQMVRLTGTGTGKPPLTSSWQPAPTAGSPLPALDGGTVWWNTAGLPAGSYTVTFKVQNTAGSVTSVLPVTLAAAPVLDFYTLDPCRIYDSRLGVVPVLSGVARVIQATGGPCGVPAGARALAANVTVIAPTGSGYGSLYPGNYPQPSTASITFAAGQTRGNNATLPLATDGTGTLTAILVINGGNAFADLSIDVFGYFMP
jgi:PKD repeat protein